MAERETPRAEEQGEAVELVTVERRYLEGLERVNDWAFLEMLYRMPAPNLHFIWDCDRDSLTDLPTLSDDVLELERVRIELRLFYADRDSEACIQWLHKRRFAIMDEQNFRDRDLVGQLDERPWVGWRPTGRPALRGVRGHRRGQGEDEA